MDPLKTNKYLYVEQTSTWGIRSVYFLGILFWLFVVWGFSGAVIADPLYRFFVGPLLIFLTAYYLISYGINLFYKKLDLKKHLAFIQNYWQEGQAEPSVDIFLPICGERLGELENTWKNVAKLDYGNNKVYVLDDSKTQCAEHRKMAEHYGFIYIERPNKGEMKKAGNLKYGYENSSGEFVVIFDADFAPHPDFLRELMSQ